ncbi:MAG: GGDEF domain-containing protein [Anaerolineales bacterium]|nr:GGDEF domain-containing protein [Anaerolineales bacterium]
MDQGFYQGVLDNLYDGVYFLDKHRRITYWNQGAERITGFKSPDMIGSSCANNILKHMDQDGQILCLNNCPVSKTLQDGQLREADIYLHHAGGHRVPVSVRVSPIYDPEGKIIGAVEIFKNNFDKVTAIEQAKEFQQLALLDPLTEIGNRRFSDLELKNSFDEFLRSGLQVGILISDIDHFKRINDTYGHNIGDKVIRMVANTLSKNLRSFEFVGRWGGEEFIIITKNLNLEDHESIANRLRILIQNSWITTETEKIRVTASFGGTILRKGDSITSAVSRADKFLYQSKNSGRNRVTVMHES